MRRRSWVLALPLIPIVACSAGLYSGETDEGANPPPGTGHDPDDAGTGGSSDAGVSADLPCDVAHLLGGYCTGCHGSPPTNGAPVVLSSLDALRAASPTYPSQTEGERASFRMSPASSAQPMPPAPYAAVPISARDAFASWIAAGMPAGSCTAPSDGGLPPVTDAGPTDAGVAGDLPCSVASTLATYCTACHGSPPSNGAPFSLNSLSALRAVSPTYPGQTLAERSLVRMQSNAQPMPPPPYARVPAPNVSDFSGWVNSGTPAGSCTAPVDGGLPPVDDAGVDAGPPDAGVSGDLPCTVAHTLGTYCTLCHGSPPANGAPFSLNSRAALLAMSPSYPGQSLGQRSVTRMQSTTQPMPPSPYARVPTADVTDFSSWVSSGMPSGSCTAPTDGGTPPLGDAGVDAGVDAGTPDAGVASDFPCDVADVLTSACTSCHGSPPTGGAPMALTTLAQLRAPSPSNASVTTGQACVNRMASSTAPMPPPPAPRASAAKQSAFAAWVSSGMPAGTCAVDAGTPDPVFSGPPTCTSGEYWTGGEGSTMRPGEACIACHSRDEGPRFAIAGTAYPTGHEYDDCYGRAAQGATVTVTDRNNVSRSFSVNSAGNFSGSASGGWPVFPIRAQISLGGRTRAMSGAVSSGDCNSCHTLQGASGAPGRVALP